MIQRFIELGEGYSDLYELIELVRTNQHRLVHLLALNTNVGGNEVTSLAAVLKPTDPGKFQALYICREGIPNPDFTPNKRYDLFTKTAEEMDKQIHTLSVKPSTMFHEKELYYHHLIGILRMNHYLAPLN